MATDSKKSAFPESFHPNHTNPALDRLNAFPAVAAVGGDAERTFPNLSGDEGGIGNAIKPVTTQVGSRGFYDFGTAYTKETQRPVNQHAGASPTLPVVQVGAGYICYAGH